MERAASFAKLADWVFRKLSEAAQKVMDPIASETISKHRILDLYVVSGGLERGFVAFIGALEDYIDQRAVLGDEANGVAEYELIWATDFFAQAIEALLCVVDELDPRREAAQSSPESAASLGMDTGIRTRLREAVHFEPTDRDDYNVLLAEATRHHESLRDAVVNVRMHISRTFDFSDLFD